MDLLRKPIPVLLGTTPPMKRSPNARKEELFWQTVGLLERLGSRVDGCVIYDVWEGNERGKFRTKYGDNRPFALRLREATGKEQVVCCVVVHQGMEGFRAWLDGAAGMGLTRHVYVGASTERFQVKGPHPKQALAMASNLHGGKVEAGAITIPWRHGEAGRLAQKAQHGARFALSQIVLEARSGTRLVQELDRACRERDVEPPTVFWNFAPVVDLDVALEDFDYFEVFPHPENPGPHEDARRNWERIAGAAKPLEASIEVAAENLRALLQASLATRVRPGITFEGLGMQNLPYVEALARRLFQVRDEVLAKSRP